MKWENLNIQEKTTIILICTIVVLFIAICLLDSNLIIKPYENIANFLYGSNPDSNGKLLTTILTTLGGYGALYGLYLNNKKVNELVRQNDISTQNSNDKRFGEAIGYLNNDNEGIAIGGAYALYQLAKEDSRYAPIITNIFYNYINSTDKKDSQTFKTVLSIFFSENDLFTSDKELVFNDLHFTNVEIYCNRLKIRFESCSFINTSILGDISINFQNCSIQKSFVGNFNTITIHKCICININIGNSIDCDISIIDGILTNIKIFTTIIKDLYIKESGIGNIKVYTDTAKNIYIDNISKEELSSNLFLYYASEIKSIYINDELIKDRSWLNIIRDDAMKRDKIYRWTKDFQN